MGLELEPGTELRQAADDVERARGELALTAAVLAPRDGQVMSLVDKVRDALTGQDHRVDAEQLIERLEALSRFLRVVDPYLPDADLVAAHTLVERAGSRLKLSQDHTVVALAGSTGSGKSSLFNALARLKLSPVGVRRPTTGVAHACVWGPLDAANRLLDWVGVLPRHRFVRESALDGDDEAALRGLVLLDLPDFDSVERGHRLEVDRLLGLVDQVIWVVDPQKYGDRILHNAYLKQFRAHADITIVVLNQADRLSTADTEIVLADLKRLLEEDGLAGAPVLATSAKQPGMLTELRESLEKTVAARQAALLRLSGDLDTVGEQLADFDRAAGRRGRSGPVDRAAAVGGAGRVGRGARGGGGDRERVPAPGGGRRPAGRWSAACGGCGRIRSGGCTWRSDALDGARSFRVPPCRRRTPRRSPRSG